MIEHRYFSHDKNEEIASETQTEVGLQLTKNGDQGPCTSYCVKNSSVTLTL